MKIIFKVIKAGSGNDIYFERLSEALKKVDIQSEIQYYSRYFQYFPWLLKVFNKNTNGDIIHSNVEYGWAFRENNKRLFVTLHHNVFDQAYRNFTTFPQRIFHDFILKPNIQKSLRSADKIIAVSNYTKQSFLRTFGEVPIDVIYNFVDTEKYKPIKTIALDKRFKLLFVGNLIRRKGADLLPKIMSQLGKKYVLYYTSGLRTSIPKQFTLSNMVPLGRLSEEKLIEEYNKCDALLFPSRLEGFGYTVAEAMACGKPVISTNTSSISELVEEGKNGFLCDPNNLNEIVNKIRLLQKLITKEKKKFINNTTKIRSKFNENLITKQYEKLVK
jgi:glycosyltransferase involved in cell wall biosynthesis